MLALGSLLAGCSSQIESTKYVFNENHKIMVGGKMYYSTGQESKLSVRPERINGEIMTVIEETEVPGRDYEANFGVIGYEIQRVGDGFIEVHIADTDQWIVFKEGPFESKTYVFDGKEYTSEELWEITGAKYMKVDVIFAGAGADVDWSAESVNVGNYQYFPVIDDRFQTISEMKAYIESLITYNLAATDYYQAFEGETPQFREIDGKLYQVLADRGTMQFDTYSTRVVTETDNSAVIEVDSFDGEETHTVVMLKIDGEWLVDYFDGGYIPRKENMIPEWLDADITYEQLDTEGNYISKEYIDEELCDYQIYDMGGYQYTFARDREDVEGKLVYVDITETKEDRTGPLGICIGDSYEILTSKYPDTYSRYDLPPEDGYVLHVDNEITFVPEGITPFVKVEFENNEVSVIHIFLIRLT